VHAACGLAGVLALTPVNANQMRAIIITNLSRCLAAASADRLDAGERTQ
jgi:hypothetical protein